MIWSWVRPPAKLLGKQMLTVFAIGIAAGVLMSHTLDSSDHFMSVTSYFTGGRGVYQTLYLAVLLLALGFPGFTLMRADLDIVAAYGLPRMKSVLQWYIAKCIQLVWYSFATVFAYLFPLGIINLLFSQKDLTSLQIFFCYGVIWILFSLFFSFMLLVVNLLTFSLPTIIAPIAFIAAITTLGYIPWKQWQIVDILNPLFNLFYDMHQFQGALSEYDSIEQLPYAIFTPQFSAAYFVIIIGITAVCGWFKIQRTELSLYKKGQGDSHD